MLVVIAEISCEIGRETRYTWCSCETEWHAGARSQVSRRSSAPILSRRLFVNTTYSRNLVRLHCYCTMVGCTPRTIMLFLSSLFATSAVTVAYKHMCFWRQFYFLFPAITYVVIRFAGHRRLYALQNIPIPSLRVALLCPCVRRMCPPPLQLIVYFAVTGALDPPNCNIAYFAICS